MNPLKKLLKKIGTRVTTLVITTATLICAGIGTAHAQLTPTIVKQALSNNVVCVTATSNLTATLLITNTIPNRKHLGIGVVFGGGASTNTGVIGFQFKIRFAGTNNLLTTTTPFTITSTANGVTGVADWGVIPDYNLGPGDAIVLTGVTNAAVNVNGGFPGGSVTVSNVFLQYPN